MSSSVPNSTIFLTDTMKKVNKKINKAFSGGCQSLEEFRKKGANLEVDIAYIFMGYFMTDFERYKEVGRLYGEGKMMTSEVKKECSQLIQGVVARH